MVKQKINFTCSSCFHKTSKWFGCCPGCNAWNTLEEGQTIHSQFLPSKTTAGRSVQLHQLDTIQEQSKERMQSGIKEWDRVSGGGIMPGSFIMLTGDPGIGKSTLLLHIAHCLAKTYKVFYFSSEESLEQVKVRAQRIGCAITNILFSDQAHLDDIIATAHAEKPDVVIIDSIQNCYSSAESNSQFPGSINHLKESAFRLMRLAKENKIAILLSGHITKDGALAGPKTLEHMVDAVFYLQGEDRWQTRVLRGVKNRFGTINELGFFEMGEQGLEEVSNINQHLLEEITASPGSVLISHMEGSRPLLLELQALTIATKFGLPQRVVTGLDQKQVVLIAAILEKYLQVKLSAHDIFFKISGGLKIKGNASDLGIALALLSSYFQQPLPSKSLALAEISLTGQVKPINHIGLHLHEIEKFGIEQLFVAKNQSLTTKKCRIKKFSNVVELLSLFE
jgi:DNA repair protein RadA/Sms